MYRRSKFLEVLLDIRQQMARDADYDVDLFAEMIRSGRISKPAAINDTGESIQNNSLSLPENAIE